MRNDYRTVDFTFTNLPGWPTGDPTRGVLHTDGNPRPHTALNALRWGDRERAFSSHYYVEGKTVYRAIAEDHQAFHVLEPRIAEQEAYPVTWPGLAKKRGDIRAIGIEHVMNRDGSWSQATRITSVLLGADITRRHPKIDWSEHARWDPWTRPHDVGDALYIPDWIADVRDLIAGRTPYRVVGPTASGTPHPGPDPNRPPPRDCTAANNAKSQPSTLADRLSTLERRVTSLERG